MFVLRSGLPGRITDEAHLNHPRGGPRVLYLKVCNRGQGQHGAQTNRPVHGLCPAAALRITGTGIGPWPFSCPCHAHPLRGPLLFPASFTAPQGASPNSAPKSALQPSLSPAPALQGPWSFCYYAGACDPLLNPPRISPNLRRVRPCILASRCSSSAGDSLAPEILND